MMELPGPTLIQNIKRRQEAEGGNLVKRRHVSGGTVRPVECDGATSAAAAAAAAKATAALRAAPALPGVTPRRRPSGQARETEPQQVLERTPPNRVTTPLRVYTRKSQRRSVSEDRGSVVSVHSRPSPPRSDSEATPSPKMMRASEQAKSRKSLAEERLPATPQRRSLCITGHRKEAEESPAPAPAALAAPAAAPASPVASPAPASPTSVQRSRARESCSICCEDVSEGSAVRLSCSHGWYCFQCLKRHAEARLEMGSVDVCCPQCNVQIAERTLRQVLPAKVVERLLKRSLEQAVSSVGDLYACPTPNCTFRVALEEGDIPRLKCPQCKKTCCLLCGRQPYHRGRTCQEAAEKNGKRRDSGEAALKRWMEDTGSKQCPTCHAIVTKQNLDKQGTQYVECHKMMCRNCETKFCFKCLKLLSKQVCNCSRHEHGFINPKTGRRLNHVEAKAKAKAKTRR